MNIKFTNNEISVQSRPGLIVTQNSPHLGMFYSEITTGVRYLEISDISQVRYFKKSQHYFIIIILEIIQ